MIRLTGAVKAYPWGSTSVMQDHLGRPTDGDPLAELWFGAHPAGSSIVVGGPAADLRAHIAADPVATLGSTPGERAELPFLVKLLAPGEPVSLQVHPSSELARAGFADEERRRIERDAPERIFADGSAKPEMVFAVSEFEGLAGFRPLHAIAGTLAMLPDLAGLRAAVASGPGRIGRAAIMSAVFAVTPDDVDRLVAAARSVPGDAAITTLLELADRYPSDRGVLAGLILERHRLGPGDSLYVPAGTPHSYLSGLAVEVMASSDTVVRGGLTHKHVDVDRFLESIDFVRGPAVPSRAPEVAPAVRMLAPHDAPFSLTVVTSPATEVQVPGWGPRIALALDGRLELRCATGPARSAVRGEAFFAAASDGVLSVSGSGTLVVASAAAAGRAERRTV